MAVPGFFMQKIFQAAPDWGKVSALTCYVSNMKAKKYTKKALETGVEGYFKSISRDVPLVEKTESGSSVPVVNKLNEPAMATEWLEPPTVGGLCAFLGIHRSTWAAYCDPEKHPDFAEATEWARDQLYAWRENALLTQRHVRGVMFDLENNYGQHQKHQVELGEATRKAMTAVGMPIEEREQLLKEMFNAMGAGNSG